MAIPCNASTPSLAPSHPPAHPPTHPPNASLAGFPVDQLSPEEVVLAWYGLGTYWGNARSQNAKGHLVSSGIGRGGDAMFQRPC